MKILLPAGNFESLKAAVYNGADEVYLGINDFNARNNIDGFNLDNLQQAVDFAHIYGVKVCLAINILFSDDEIQDALDTVVKAYNMGVDAFIVQDLGLITLICKNYPEIELHASTQMGIHNLEGVRFVEKFGIKRVVLSRETPLEEIKRIKENSQVEIEYFAQGALCVSFSGNCYLSSYLLGASGNRGRCKQLCRLPYTLKKDGKKVKSGYLLSAKDINMSNRLKELEKAGVDVLKIEGRARRPFYVATATREYRRVIDGFNADQDKLELAFNRQYTAGYFDGNGNIISDLQNHIGVCVGKVEKVDLGKNFNRVFFSSNRDLYPKSTFKIFDNGVEKCVLTAFDLNKIQHGKYVLTTTQKVCVGNTVNLIVDAEQEREALSVKTKRNIDLELTAYAGQPIKAATIIDGNAVEITGDILERAQKQPLTVDDVKENFSKNEYFEPNITVYDTDGAFIPKGKLNEFRRKVYEFIYRGITEKYRRDAKTIKIGNARSVKAFTDFQFIEKVSDCFNKKNVIYSPETYSLNDVEALKERCLCVGKKLYLDTPNFALAKDVELLREIIEKTGVGVVANNYYALSFDAEIIIGGGLNLYNSFAADCFGMPFIVSEDSLIERTDYPYMTLRHCPIKSHVGGDCLRCKYEDGFEYVSERGKVLKLKRKKLSTCTFYLI